MINNYHDQEGEKYGDWSNPYLDSESVVYVSLSEVEYETERPARYKDENFVEAAHWPAFWFVTFVLFCDPVLYHERN